MQDPHVSRSDFLKQGLSWLQETLVPPFLQNTPFQSSSSSALRPPGALPEAEFLKTCDPFCHDCQSACPRQAIVQSTFGFPEIHVEMAPCVMCTDVPCTKACPTGALIPLASPLDIAMGTALIEATVCTAYHGSGCRVCYDVCPIPEAAIRLAEGLPEILPAGCTGCGLCVFHCPTAGAIAVKLDTIPL